MRRKTVTQLFPWLLPVRKQQRMFCFYMGMRMDRNRYSQCRVTQPLPELLFETKSQLYNSETGFDMKYQENKVFNLKLAASGLNGLMIRPGETFSFWQAIRGADWEEPYRDGLVVLNGELTTAPGGGLCQISNLLLWLFLHTPMTILERHGHKSREFPVPDDGTPLGVDAAISEGWLDLKVKNESTSPYQIFIDFDEQHMSGRIVTDDDRGKKYEVVNEGLKYYQSRGKIYEETEVVRRTICAATGECVDMEWLYNNRSEIGYALPQNVTVLS